MFDPEYWSQLMDKIPGAIPAIFSSMIIAFLRIVYDRDETKWIRILLEMCLCGALTYIAWAGVMALGLNLNWAVVVGGLIGYLGPVTVRAIALKYINSKLKGGK